MLTGAHLNLADEWAVFLFQMLVVATPFFLLALLGVRARTPWLVGIALTAAFWGLLLYVGVTSYGDGTGANIGLGLLMLASPFVISGATLVAGRRELGKERA